MSKPKRSPLIFVSYAHEDIEHVRPLVEQFKRRRWHVWWDRETRIGAEWRNIIDDRLHQARCVVVVWSRRSVRSRWVKEEAEAAAVRGVIVPVRLEKVQPPLGFRTYQYADLVGWHGEPDNELKRLLSAVSSILKNGVEVEPWYSPEGAEGQVSYGAQEAGDFIKRVQAQSAMFKANPAAASVLTAAFKAVSDTYDAVIESVDKFLKPLSSGKRITMARYRPFAGGTLKEAVEAKRGRCTELAERYIAEGGLRDSLPVDVPDEVVAELDRLYQQLGHADMDLFDAMASIGDTLAIESATLVNMLAGKQEAAVKARLQAADKRLQRIVRRVTSGKAKLNRLAGVLGIQLED